MYWTAKSEKSNFRASAWKSTAGQSVSKSDWSRRHSIWARNLETCQRVIGRGGSSNFRLVRQKMCRETACFRNPRYRIIRKNRLTSLAELVGVSNRNGIIVLSNVDALVTIKACWSAEKVTTSWYCLSWINCRNRVKIALVGAVGASEQLLLSFYDENVTIVGVDVESGCNWYNAWRTLMTGRVWLWNIGTSTGNCWWGDKFSWMLV